MKRTRYLLTTAALLALGATAQAQQPPGYSAPGYRPPNSTPYWNLMRGGNQTDNYYGLVRPQQQAQANFQGIQQQFDAFGREVQRQDEDLTAQRGIRPTGGRAATFNNLGHYYPSRAGVGGRMGGGMGHR